MWKNTEFDVGSAQERTKRDFKFEYLGPKVIATVKGSCGCIGELAPISLDGKQSIVGTLTVPYANHFEPDLQVPFSKLITVTFKDESKDKIYVVGKAIKSGVSNEDAAKDEKERQRISSQAAPVVRKTKSSGDITIHLTD